MKKRKMIKHGWIIALIILLVVLVILGVLYLLNQENLKAAANAKRYTQEELTEQLADSRQAVEETLAEQYPEVQVRDLTDEERTALREGTMSREELIATLIGSPTDPASSGESQNDPGSAEGSNAGHEDNTEPSPDTSETSAPEVTATPNPVPSSAPASETSPPPSSEPTPEASSAPSPAPSSDPSAETTSSPSPAPSSTPAPATSVPGGNEAQIPAEDYGSALAALVAEVYVMREEFISKLDEMFAAAKSEYMSFSEAERSRSKLVSWASGYLSKASALEKQCDAEMDRIIADTRALIRANNGDLSLLKTLAYSYAQEKSIQKSIYVQELEKRGIM